MARDDEKTARSAARVPDPREEAMAASMFAANALRPQNGQSLADLAAHCRAAAAAFYGPPPSTTAE